MGNNCQFLSTNLFQNATITASTGSTTKANVVNYDYWSTWKSVGSNDSTAETIQIDLSSAVTVGKVFLLNTNMKSGKVEYWNGSTWVAYGSAISNNTAKNLLITVTQSTAKLKLTINTTQTTNAEKFVGEFLPVSVLFEMVSNPDDWDVEDVFIGTENTARNGKVNIVREYEEVRVVNLGFNHLLSGTDANYIYDLQRSRASFMLNMCGDTEKGLYGWNWSDIKRLVIRGNVKKKLSKGSIASGLQQVLMMKESCK